MWKWITDLRLHTAEMKRACVAAAFTSKFDISRATVNPGVVQANFT